MPRYFMDLHNDTDSLDDEGVELADDDAARAFAIVNVRAVACESVSQGHLDLRHYIQVKDGRGSALFVVTFREAIAVIG